MTEVLQTVERIYAIYVCSVCGSDNIEASTKDDSLCGDCGHWMNCERLEVVGHPTVVKP